MFARAINLLLDNVQLNAYMIEMVCTSNAYMRLYAELVSFSPQKLKKKILSLVFSSGSVCFTQITYVAFIFILFLKRILLLANF